VTRIILTALACSAAALGAYFGGDSGDHWGGEVRYLYRFSDARLSGSGGSPKFNAQTNIMTGEILGYFKKRSAVTRPYVAFGGGIKWIRATGTESAAQPLGRIAALTNTEEAMAVASVGAGVKHAIGKRLLLRIDVRDYLGKRPNKIIAPRPAPRSPASITTSSRACPSGFDFSIAAPGLIPPPFRRAAFSHGTAKWKDGRVPTERGCGF